MIGPTHLKNPLFQSYDVNLTKRSSWSSPFPNLTIYHQIYFILYISAAVWGYLFLFYLSYFSRFHANSFHFSYAAFVIFVRLFLTDS